MRFVQLVIFGLFLAVVSLATAQQKEKVEEGQYALLINGAHVVGSEHTWTLWHLSDNRYELEDHFQEGPDPAAAAVAMLASGRNSRVSPELKKEVEKETVRTALVVQYDEKQRPVSFTLKGKYLMQEQTVDLLKCSSQPAAIKCSGKDDKADLKLKEPRELLYSYPFPMLLKPWLAAGASSNLMKVVTVTIGKKLQLERAEIAVSDGGPDTISLGDKQFHGHKYQMEVRPEVTGPLTLTLWTDAKGTILAVQTMAHPDQLIALVRYKNYSSPGPAPAALPEK
jgi:hypothetical protein